MLHYYADICKTRGYHFIEILVQGDPRDSICELASLEHVDYVIVGNRGKDMFKR